MGYEAWVAGLAVAALCVGVAWAASRGEGGFASAERPQERAAPYRIFVALPVRGNYAQARATLASLFAQAAAPHAVTVGIVAHGPPASLTQDLAPEHEAHVKVLHFEDDRSRGAAHARALSLTAQLGSEGVVVLASAGQRMCPRWDEALALAVEANAGAVVSLLPLAVAAPSLVVRRAGVLRGQLTTKKPMRDMRGRHWRPEFAAMSRALALRLAQDPALPVRVVHPHRAVVTQARVRRMRGRADSREDAGPDTDGLAAAPTRDEMICALGVDRAVLGERDSPHGHD